MNLCIQKHGIFIETQSLSTFSINHLTGIGWETTSLPQTGLYALNGWLLRSLHQFQDLSIICIRLAKQTDWVITGCDAANAA